MRRSDEDNININLDSVLNQFCYWPGDNWLKTLKEEPPFVRNSSQMFASRFWSPPWSHYDSAVWDPEQPWAFEAVATYLDCTQHMSGT